MSNVEGFTSKLGKSIAKSITEGRVSHIVNFVPNLCNIDGEKRILFSFSTTIPAEMVVEFEWSKIGEKCDTHAPELHFLHF